MRVWKCNNDEHINKNTDVECEICGEQRPVISIFKYTLTDEFGKVKFIWELDNVEDVFLVKKKEEIELDSFKGEQEINNVKNREVVTLVVSNHIATYSEELKILLERPKICFFKTDREKVLKNEVFNLSWEVKNAKKVFVSGIGNVEQKGNIEQPAINTHYKITAENDVGKTEQEVTVSVLPPPQILVFRPKQQKIEYGKETQLIWNLENVERAELRHDGRVETITRKGENTITPTKNTTYKIVATALDGATKLEQEIEVQVFKRVDIKSFVSNLDFVIETLPITLAWDIENASTVILSSNVQADIDVTGKNKIEVIAKKTAVFRLRAKNELFSMTSQQVKVEVQNTPIFNPSLMPTLPSGRDLIPSFELDFKELSNTVLSESQLDFRSAVKTRKKFSLIDSLRKILNP